MSLRYCVESATLTVLTFPYNSTDSSVGLWPDDARDREGQRVDYSRAAELFEQVCEGGDMLGCSNLGIHYWQGQGVEQSYDRAAELFDRACDGGHMTGCDNIADLQQEGHGVD